MRHEILATQPITINLFMQIDPVAILIYSTRQRQQFGITQKLSLRHKRHSSISFRQHERIVIERPREKINVV